MSNIFEYALRHNNYEMMERVLELYEVDLNAQFNNLTYLMKACYEGNYYLVKFLIKHGADTEIENNYGKTAIDYAVEEDNYYIVKLLLEID